MIDAIVVIVTTNFTFSLCLDYFRFRSLIAYAFFIFLLPRVMQQK